jgi:arginase
VSYIGAPLAAGQHQAGVEQGPQKIREGGLEAVVKRLGWDLHDVGDLNVESAMAQFQGQTTVTDVRNCEKIGMGNKMIHDAVREEASKGNFVITAGGDHSIASATLSGMRAVHKDLSVIWIDAHADCNTPTSSPSGNYHGMPGAHMLGWLPGLPGWEWLGPELHLKEQHLALVGLRDVDEEERKLLERSGVHVYTMYDVDRYGIGAVMDKALRAVDPSSDRPLHLSFDIDACDPSLTPGTGTCSRGGLTYREAHYICEAVSMTNQLISMDMVECNPLLDKRVPASMHGDDELITADLKTVRMALELISSSLGKVIAKSSMA